MRHQGVAFAAALGGALWLLSGCTTVTSAPAGMQPKLIVHDVVRVIATVEAVDKDSRVIALRDENGEIRTLGVETSLPNFERLRRGDRILAEYGQELAIYPDTPGSAAKDEHSKATAGAPGTRPAQIVVDTMQWRATIAGIDRPSRRLALRASDGRVHVWRASPALGRLDELNQGDHIIIRYTQITAVSVTQARQ